MFVILKPNISNVILHHQYDRLSPSEARNKGASLAKGDLLLFTDSDIILDKSSKTIENEIVDWTYHLTVMFGCSMTFGEGVQEEDTWGMRLAKQFNYNLYNFGIGGSDNMNILDVAKFAKKIFSFLILGGGGVNFFDLSTF